MSAHTVIEVGFKDCNRLFLSTPGGGPAPPGEYLRPAFCLLWAAGQGKLLVPHPEPRK